MSNDEYKKDLAGTDSVRKFLNMNDDEEPKDPTPPENLPTNIPIETIPMVDMPIGDLPIVEAKAVIADSESEDIKTLGDLIKIENIDMSKSSTETNINNQESVHTNAISPEEHAPNEGIKSYFPAVLRVGKSILPYVVIFALGLGLYFFYFSDFSINSVFRSGNLTIENVASTKSNKNLENLKKDQKDAYYKWMSQFFFEVNDDAIVSMDADVSGNGLTNFEKYLLNLNPKVYSSRGSNNPDGQLVIEDMSPWTGKPFTDVQKELINKYINKESISNRITAAALTRGVTKFAQYVAPDSPYYVDAKTLASGQQVSIPNNSSTSTSNGTPSELQSNQTAAQVAQQSNPSSPAPSNLNPGTDIDQSIPGKIDIPDNNISVPLTWTQSVKDFDRDLDKGTVHYPGTAMPGQVGTSYISGHSSGYLWNSSPYKDVFAGLGMVKDGTSFTVTATQKDGKKVIFYYVVAGRGEYAANDQAQFISTAESVVALSTCWPVGTTARRLVLYGKLSQSTVFQLDYEGFSARILNRGRKHWDY